MNKLWTPDEVSIAKDLVNQGKSFKEISIILNRTHHSVASKLNNLGVHSFYNTNKHGTKYESYDWKLIQSEYDSGLSQTDLHIKFGISVNALYWGSKNNKLKCRTQNESTQLSWINGKYPKSQLSGYKLYRQQCEFIFDLKQYPSKFDFTLIQKHGWYQAKNRGNVPNGITRDHMYSIKDGFLNKVDPAIIRHPANCELLCHYDNIKKHSKSSITLKELMNKINSWENCGDTQVVEEDSLQNC